jgi:UDP-N-acetylmuramoyl-L-alanyl-D-glutamate--2,6-diaminopimelate ligase
MMQVNQHVCEKNLSWLKSQLSQISKTSDFKQTAGLDASLVINDLCLDSREIKPGDVFVALSGFNVHGLDYAYQAERAGAIAVISEPTKAERTKYVGRQKPLQIPVIECADLSDVLGDLACAFYDHPSKKLKVTAITGTNGKTSTAWLMMHALEQLGIKAGYIGTLGVGGISQLENLQNTTPSAIAIQKSMAAMSEAGYQHVCIEVSSHALDQKRFNGTQVETAIFTNLSRDHLDYHNSMQAYAAAKLKLFTDFNPTVNIINADDAVGAAWLANELKDQPTVSYGIASNAAQFKAVEIMLLPQGIAFELDLDGHSTAFETSLLGAFNVLNSLAVIAALKSLGYSIEQMPAVVAELQPVPGRMNRIDDARNGSTMVVDYAHTPDALLQVLKALRAHTNNKLWCVFGCGGNRDKGKRAMMGEIAEQYADYVVLTDDNPRFESPAQIIADIEAGMKSKPHVINNRKQAIAYVLDQSERGDIILIAGKGHESTQEVNGMLLPFNDMDMVKELLQVAI